MRADTQDWQNLPPAALIGFTVKILVQLAKNGWQSFVPLIAIISVSDKFSSWYWVGAIAAIILIALAVFALLAYRNFAFAIDGDEIRVKQGVFNKRQTSLPFERIQAIKLRHPIYLRPFKLSILEIESAGSKGNEIDLPGVAADFSQTLKELVLATKEGRGSSKADDISISSTHQTLKQDLLITVEMNDLVRHGFVSRQAFLILGAVIGVSAGSSNIYDYAEDQISTLFDALNANFSVLAQTALGIISLIILLGLGLTASIILTVIRFYRFKVERQHDGYHISHGLIEGHERTLAHHKIQCFKLQQSITGGWVKRYMGKIIQAGSTFGEGDFSKRTRSEVLPGLRSDVALTFEKDLYPDFDRTDIRPTPVLRRYAFYLIRLYAFFALIPASIFMINGYWSGLFFLAIPLLTAPLCIRAQRNSRYGFSDHYGIITGGVFTRWRVLFPLYKVQSVKLSQSVFQKRRQIASVYIALAGEKIHIPYIPLKTAQHIRDILLYRVEVSNKRWM